MMTQLDPNIILQAGRGVTPLEQPMDVIGKALQLRQLMNQGQLQQMQIAQNSAAMQRSAQTRQAIANSPDLESAAEAVRKTGDWETADKMVDAVKKQQQAKAALQKSYLESNKLEQDQLTAMTQSTGAAARSVAAIKDPAQRVQAWQQALQEQAQQFQPSPTDTPKMQAIKASRLQQIQAEEQSLQNLQNPDQLDQLLAKHINDSKTHADWLEEAKEKLKASTPTGFHAAVGPDGKQGIFQVTGAGEVKQIPGLKPVPPAAIQIQNAAPGAGVGGVPVNTPPLAPGQPVPPDHPALRGLSPDQASLVKKIASYEIPVNSRFMQGPKNQALIARAIQLNPNFNQNDAEQAAKFLKDLSSSSPTSAGGQVQAMNNAFEHLGSMASLVPQMGSSSIPLLNKLSNAAGQATGSTAPVKWDTASHLLAAEVQKMIKGGMATEGETKQLLENLNGAASPAQKKAALGEIAEFMYGKIKSFENRRDSLLGGMSPGTSFMTPSAQQNLISVYKAAGKQPPEDLLPAKGGASYTRKIGDNPQANKTPVITSQEQYDKLPAGASYVDAEGNPHKKGGA